MINAESVAALEFVDPHDVISLLTSIILGRKCTWTKSFAELASVWRIGLPFLLKVAIHREPQCAQHDSNCCFYIVLEVQTVKVFLRRNEQKKRYPSQTPSGALAGCSCTTSTIGSPLGSLLAAVPTLVARLALLAAGVC